jgi:antitoxin component of MazEF toxin-antitoxin module
VKSLGSNLNNPIKRGKIMTEVVLDIKQWGNNLGGRLPLAIAKEVQLKAHQTVKREVVEGLYHYIYRKTIDLRAAFSAM